MRSERLAVILALGVLASCQGRDGSELEAEGAIVGGTTDIPAGNPGLTSAVGIIAYMFGPQGPEAGLQPQLGCTGVLIAPNLVLTAGHCLMDKDTPEAIRFARPGETPTLRKVTASKAFLDNQSLYPNFDVAWMRFEGDTPPGYQPIEMLSDAERLVHGLPLTLVGFGRTEAIHPDRANPASDDTMRSVDTVVDRYVDGSRAHGLFTYGPSPGKGECSGDSGGPAYVKLDGRWLLAGTTNGGDGRLTRAESVCNGQGIYTFGFQYKGWIEKTAGVMLPGPPGPSAYEFDEAASFSTFGEWCRASRVPLSAWVTIDAVSRAANSFDCAEIEKAPATRTSLTLLPNRVRDLRPLSSLVQLTSLNANWNEIADLSPLSTLTELTRLDLQSNKVTDLSPLAALRNLKELHLSGNPLPAGTPCPVPRAQCEM
jgi:hypothetical protein